MLKTTETALPGLGRLIHTSQRSGQSSGRTGSPLQTSSGPRAPASSWSGGDTFGGGTPERPASVTPHSRGRSRRPIARSPSSDVFWPPGGCGYGVSSSFSRRCVCAAGISRPRLPTLRCPCRDPAAASMAAGRRRQDGRRLMSRGEGIGADERSLPHSHPRVGGTSV